MSNYNMTHRTIQGVSWHERTLIRQLELKLERATSLAKRERYAKRIIAAKARLCAFILENS